MLLLGNSRQSAAWRMRRRTAAAAAALVVWMLAGPGAASVRDDTWDARVCGDGWPQYAVMHQEMLAGKRAGRFLTFEPDPWRGYANQLLGISSALATALLTQRALLIRDDELAAHFASPFIAWRTEGPARAETLYDAIKDCDAHELWSALVSIDLEELFPPHVEHASISTNILWAPKLFSNPRYEAEVNGWGLADRDSFFACAMSYLFRPTFRLRRALAPLERRIQGRYSIGLQLRLNPETAQVRLDDIAAFIACGRHLARLREVEESDIRWVVATDVPDALVHVQHLVGAESDAVVWWDHPQDDGTGRRAEFIDPSLDPVDVMKWGTKKSADHYMLALCNETIISFASTFGLTAAHFIPAAPASRTHHVFGRHYHQPALYTAPICETRLCSGPCC